MRENKQFFFFFLTDAGHPIWEKSESQRQNFSRGGKKEKGERKGDPTREIRVQAGHPFFLQKSNTFFFFFLSVKQVCQKKKKKKYTQTSKVDSPQGRVASPNFTKQHEIGTNFYISIN